MITQNTSHAVMAQRIEPHNSLDDFPTPPWATRALIEHVLGDLDQRKRESVLEPCANRGFMVRPLQEYFGSVDGSDCYDYGAGYHVDDFLFGPKNKVDWVIANPPFKLAEEFILKGMKTATQGVCVLVRSTFTESVGRYERLFKNRPPTIVAQFVERVPMVKGRCDPKASTATAYMWLVWQFGRQSQPFKWIPPCRKQLEHVDDYEL